MLKVAIKLKNGEKEFDGVIPTLIQVFLSLYQVLQDLKLTPRTPFNKQLNSVPMEMNCQGGPSDLHDMIKKM